MAKKIGRPSKYTLELASEICLRIAEGETLREVCRDPKMPTKATIMNWCQKKPAFLDQYAKARTKLLEHWAEEIIDIADDGTNDWEERQNRDGSTYIALNSEHVNRSRLRVDTRKWLLSKLVPKKYGDTTKLLHAGEDGGKLTINLVQYGDGKKWKKDD